MEWRTIAATARRALVALMIGFAGSAAQGQLASFNFDTDPGWTARLNTPPGPGPFVTQNFGYSLSNNAGGSLGELGGTIIRSTTPAWVADVLSTPKTYDDMLIAEGRISLSSQNASGWVHFGWFNDERQGWRPWNSLVFRLVGEGTSSRVDLDSTTQTWKGTGLPTSINIPHNGSSHHWQMIYDPNGGGGLGAISFSLNGGTPAVHTLPVGFKNEGAVFNRFGVFNGQTPGGQLRVFFDDVIHNGSGNAFGSPAFGWEEHGNRVTFRDQEQRPWHNFGFKNTNHAGGASPGEIGGLIWRPAPHAEPYYAVPLEENLTFDDYLFASGKFALVRGSTDGGARFGWFNMNSLENPIDINSNLARAANYLAINVEGPTRVGHYFRPHFSLSDATYRDSNNLNPPVILPDGASHDFTFEYDPDAGSFGRITVTLDDEVFQWNLTASDRQKGALFDHFGIFGLSPDGPFVEMYLDDLVFTTAVPEPCLGMVLLGGLAVLAHRPRRRASHR